jgi:hypothetical protein
MYFRYQQTANLITVADNYADLVNIDDNGDMQFTFTYTVNPGHALNHGSHIVNVQVLSRYVAQVPLLGNTHRGMVDNQTLVDNIRELLPHAKQAVKQRTTYVMAHRSSNILSYVNNEVIRQLLARVDASTIQQLNTPELKVVQAGDVKQSNNPQPLLQRIAMSLLVPDVSMQLSGSAAVVAKSLAEDMISRQGLDPSYILSLTPRSSSESQTLHGLSNTSRAIEQVTDPATQLLNFHLFPPTSEVPPTTTDDVSDTELVQVLRTVTHDTVEISVPVTIPASKLRLESADITNAFVQFDLVNSETNEPVDRVIKTLNIAREMQVYSTPVRPPILKAAVTPNSTYGTLQIRQVDPGATSVEVYKRVLRTASAQPEPYSLVGTYSLTSQQEALQIKVDVPLLSTAIYRVIPVGIQDTQGFEFSNVVLKPPHYTPLRSVALTGLQIDKGIQLEVRNIPQRCVAIQFLRWNMTTFQNVACPTFVKGDAAFIDAAARQADLITVTDTDIQVENVYRYVARLIYLDGDVEDFGHVLLGFVQPAPGQVATTITNLVVTHDNVPDVSFTINTVTSATNMDAIKSMLTNQDLLQYFQGDIQAQRDQLTNIIAHTIDRVDLTTGTRESFGTVTVSDFTDSALRKSQAVSALQYGHDYRYEIYPLLRAPETMFDSLVKSAVDPTTRKSYTYNPSKFLHPLALGSQGVIVSPDGAQRVYGKDPMSFGVVGSITTVRASFDNDIARVINQIVTPFNRSLNIITWQVQGDIAQIDHFLVMKTVNGVRTTVGKAHSEFPYGACQYFHQVNKRDDGAVSYVIVPVMNDYQVGPAVTTNTVLVDAP